MFALLLLAQVAAQPTNVDEAARRASRAAEDVAAYLEADGSADRMDLIVRRTYALQTLRACLVNRADALANDAGMESIAAVALAKAGCEAAEGDFLDLVDRTGVARDDEWVVQARAALEHLTVIATDPRRRDEARPVED
jgi:hypothetical protein